MKKEFSCKEGSLISEIRLDLAYKVNAAETAKLSFLSDDKEIKKSLCKVRLANSQKSKARGTI